MNAVTIFFLSALLLSNTIWSSNFEDSVENKTDKKSTEKKLKCPAKGCRFESQYISNTRSHFYRRHQELNINDFHEIAPKKMGEKKFICPIGWCTSKYTQQRRLREHFVREHKKLNIDDFPVVARQIRRKPPCDLGIRNVTTAKNFGQDGEEMKEDATDTEPMIFDHPCQDNTGASENDLSGTSFEGFPWHDFRDAASSAAKPEPASCLNEDQKLDTLLIEAFLEGLPHHSAVAHKT